MSEIIIFPKIGDGLNRQLEEAMAAQDYERAYDIIHEMERHIELSHKQQLIKLEILQHIGSFIELREEASILLNQGHPSYDVIIRYFLESLFALEQYQTVIELIESLRSEDLDHGLMMQLLPLYDAAQHRRNERDKRSTGQLQQFLQWPVSRQLHYMVELIEGEQFNYCSTVRHLLGQSLHPKVQTLMIEYLLLAGAEGKIQFNKLEQHVTINLADLPHVQESRLAAVWPHVIDWFDMHAPAQSPAVSEWLNDQQMMRYPLDFKDSTDMLYDIETIAEAYVIYLTRLFALEEETLQETADHTAIIRAIERTETAGS
ncbi:hypothetical protein ERX35_003050 [Macrococcus equipercicus]|uniref:DUF3196 domain-containing protein n=1 Tax=Macrococcus equipercicus TaxID=69967 RepID=A0ABQ6R9L5_9STAP|nr:hypothetical protein [Macrococcus equipercicus]KAA1039980.1 hypothetical protein ERX35_003050 [Macrococcus equipercicus]